MDCKQLFLTRNYLIYPHGLPRAVVLLRVTTSFWKTWAILLPQLSSLIATMCIICMSFVRKTRDALREHLSEAGISTVLNYPKALPFYPAYAYLSHVPKDFPAAYFNQSRILSLPIYPEMPEETITHVANTISQFWSSECSKVIELTAANLIAIEPRTRVLSDN